MINARSVSAWPSPLGQEEALLLFAERWDEALFHYSLDSFRFRVYNTPALCEELVDAAHLANVGILSWASLPPVRDELVHQLERDDVARILLGTAYESLLKALKGWNASAPDSNTAAFAASTIVNQIKTGYLREIMSRVVRAVAEVRKDEVITGAGAVITELLRNGYSPYYLHREGQSFFFDQSRAMPKGALGEFLAMFDGESRSYRVVFPMRTRSALLATRADSEYISHRRRLSPVLQDNTEEASFFIGLDVNTEFLIFSNVRTPDPISARVEAEQRLATAASLIGFLIHKLHVDPPDVALVYQDDPPTSARRVRPEIRATLKRPDVHQKQLKRSVDEILEILVSDRVAEASRTRLEGALRAHISGTHATTPQNQFSNLWTALETLAGSTTERNTMETVLQCATPLLCRKYFLKLICALERDITRQIPVAYRAAMAARQNNESRPRYLVRLVATDELKDLRMELYSACERAPLLKNRIFRFHETLTDARVARRQLLEHEDRIRWHLQRIYRNRNALVHGGVTGSHLALLVPNLHDYVDHVFTEVVDRLGSEADHPSFEKLFFQFDIEYTAYKKGLDLLVETPQPQKGLLASAIVFGEVGVT